MKFVVVCYIAYLAMAGITNRRGQTVKGPKPSKTNSSSKLDRNKQDKKDNYIQNLYIALSCLY